MGEKGEGFTGTIIKDTWTKPRGGELGWWRRGGGKRQKTVLEKQFKKKEI